ncbi:MAG TPA: hypothetical protein VGS19_09420 [Streptosporangiaceae bacterium]|nr:hypothetical protein [Streptosporangiaceae bacterium]
MLAAGMGTAVALAVTGITGGVVAVASAATAHHATHTAPSPWRSATVHPYGAVISTGVRNSAGELVFYGVKVHLHELPGTTFGVTGGYRKGGNLTSDVETNETNGSDLSPGFHAVESALGVNGQSIPEFGYYVGPAAKIIGVAAGKTLQAAQAHWSIDRQVVIFWFPLGLRTDVTKLAAYNAAGHRLPTGDNSIHHG